MCNVLIGENNIKPRIAEEDIRVFKAVYLNKDGKTWHGIYQDHYTAPLNTLITAEDEEDIRLSAYGWICIGCGFFHSCADINSIKNRFPYARVVVVEAIIPKGSVYYRSKVGNDFCSKQIIVTDKIVYKDGDDIKPLLKHPDVLEIVEKDGEKWLHVKDCEHEVYFATKSVGESSWRMAINMDVELPSTDDFNIIAKYKNEIHGFCEEEGIEAFDGCYWSSREYFSHTAWFYDGYNGRLYNTRKYNPCRVRLVLTHAACPHSQSRILKLM